MDTVDAYRFASKDWEFDPVLRTQLEGYIATRYRPEEPGDTVLHNYFCDFASSSDTPMSEDEELLEDAEIADGVLGERAAEFVGAAARGVAEHPATGLASAGKESAAKHAFYAPDSSDESLKSWLDTIDEPFSTTLLALIDKKGLADVDVYKQAHMSRQLFSRIRSDANYRPAKKTVLALCIALKLSLEEMSDLLARAGFALSRASKRDVIVEYFALHSNYNLFEINEALYEFDQPLI